MKRRRRSIRTPATARRDSQSLPVQNSIWNSISRKAWDPEWKSTILCCAGHLTDEPNLFEQLLDILADENTDDIFRHRLFLAAECLGEIPDTYLLRNRINRIAEGVYTLYRAHKKIQTEVILPHKNAWRALAHAASEVRGVFIGVAAVENRCFELIQSMGRKAARSDVIQALSALAKDRKPRRRQQWCQTVQKMDCPPESVPQLFELLNDEQNHVSGAAMDALVHSANFQESVRERLCAQWTSPAKRVRWRVLDALGSLNPEPPEALTIVLGLMHDQDDGLRGMAAQVAGTLERPTREIVSRLVHILDEDSFAPIWGPPQAAQALANIAKRCPELVGSEVLDKLHFASRRVESATDALGSLANGRDQAASALLGLISSRYVNDDDRMNALRSFPAEFLLAEEAVPILMKLVSDCPQHPRWIVRNMDPELRRYQQTHKNLTHWYAIAALGRLALKSPQRSTIVGALIAYTQKKELSVAAAKALGAIPFPLPGVKEALLSLTIRRMDTSSRLAAVEALVNLELVSDATETHLANCVVHSRTPLFQEHAIEALTKGGCRSDSFIATLATCARRTNVEVRRAAIRGLVRLPSNSTVVLKALTAGTRDPDREVKEKATLGLVYDHSIRLFGGKRTRLRTVAELASLQDKSKVLSNDPPKLVGQSELVSTFTKSRWTTRDEGSEGVPTP